MFKKWAKIFIVVIAVGLLFVFVIRNSWWSRDSGTKSWIFASNSKEAKTQCATNLRKLYGAVEMVGVDSSPYACFMNQQEPGEAKVAIRGPDEEVDLLEHRYIKKSKYLTCPDGGLYKVGATNAHCTKHGVLPWTQKNGNFVTGKQGVFENELSTWFVGKDFILRVSKDRLAFDSKDVQLRVRLGNDYGGDRGVFRQGPKTLVFALDKGRKAVLSLQKYKFAEDLLLAVEPFIKK